jgi:hypothetical protein
MTISTETESMETKSALIVTIQNLQRHVERLEQEAALIRQELTQLIHTLTVVARFTIEDECYEITQAEVDAARAKLEKPWPNEAVIELVLTQKMAERTKQLSRTAQFDHLMDTVATIRNESMQNGTAIEHEWEAAIGD